jgi:hypothetical protein
MKEAFMGEKGLVGSVRTLDLEKVFDLSNVKRVSVFLSVTSAQPKNNQKLFAGLSIC